MINGQAKRTTSPWHSNFKVSATIIVKKLLCVANTAFLGRTLQSYLFLYGLTHFVIGESWRRHTPFSADSKLSDETSNDGAERETRNI